MWYFLQPEEGVAEQEVAHLVAAEVEDLGAPVLVLALARVGVLVEMGAVEETQAVRIAWEVRRHPVEQDADAVLMAVIDEVHEVIGRAEAAGRRKIAGHLVAPRPVEGVLGDGQQFDVGVAHLLDVVHQLVGQFAIAEEAVVLGARFQLPRWTS